MNAPSAEMLVLKTACVCLLAFIILLLEHFFARVAYAEEACEYTVAKVVSVQGNVKVRRKQTATEHLANLGDTLCAGDSLHAQKNSRAATRLANGSTVRTNEKTDATFLKAEENKVPSLMDLHKGAIHVISRASDPFKIITPHGIIEAVGTEFFIGIDEEEKTRVILFEGRMSISNDQGSLTLAGEEAAVIYQHKSPQKEHVIIHPTDAVQWALHYPTIIDDLLDPPSQDEQSANFLIHQAGHLLTVGRVDEAMINIEQALTLEPDNSDAYALQAIIAVVQNDNAQARDFAMQAVELDANSATAKLALSYAQQAHFDVEDALATVHEAVKLDSQNALAWARLAELQMSTGQLDRALDAAQQAVSLNPDIAKTRTVLGFAYLLQINTEDAKTVFNEAILLDQTDPMPRLGLGLALIREGELEAGRIELEIAVSLDPANSLIRSYLGKAYFEEDRYSLSSTQFDLAKALDPFDPTPWLYDAIQKQTQNRPAEALGDIEKSIELNDNRAVYRSRLLLDQDQAGRGSSLARIYDNLGFEKRALMETTKSLSYDPANHSAHRFLSDAYTNIPRHEIARVSELLQAQLLQPINVNPVQPHLAVADLNIITNTGPAVAGFNEFTPLFERNKPQLVASGIAGSNNTFGDEVVASVLYDRASISIGQFHYQTDGFRPNNDETHNIYNAFMQYAVTPKFNVQAELRIRKTEHGDLLLNFDANEFDETKRRKIDEDVARIGARYTMSPNQDLLVSAKYIDRLENNNLNNAGFQIEAQHLFRKKYLNSTIGGSIYHFSWNEKKPDKDPLEELKCAFLPNDKTCVPLFDEIKRENLYIYTNTNFPSNFSTTLGLSYDSFTSSIDGTRADKINPKFGLQWDIFDSLRLRFAWFKTTKSHLVAQQSLEPTQVAGFNQFFDDTNGTRARRMGIGLDSQVSNNLYSGIEASTRNLDVPFDPFVGTEEHLQAQKEQLIRAYLYWSPHVYWAISAELKFEKFTRNSLGEIIFDVEPTRIQTLSAPLSIEYFHPSGFFSKFTTTYVGQDLTRKEDEKKDARKRDPTDTNSGVDTFFLLDSVFGYRLPNRRGILSLEGRNLLNKKFFYRNINFNQSEAISPPFIPERTFYVRLTLNF